MTREEAIDEINKVFTPSYANYIVTALTEGTTVSDFQRRYGRAYEAGVKDGLEQEPCEDAVSRAEVIKIAKEMYLEVANMELDVKTISDCISYTASKCREVLERRLQALSSVTPQDPILEKDGTLIVTTEHCGNVGRVLVQYGTNGTLFYQDQELRKGHWKHIQYEETLCCSECGCRLFDEQTYIPLHYCPNCGAKMQEVKE